MENSNWITVKQVVRVCECILSFEHSKFRQETYKFLDKHLHTLQQALKEYRQSHDCTRTSRQEAADKSLTDLLHLTRQLVSYLKPENNLALQESVNDVVVKTTVD